MKRETKQLIAGGLGIVAFFVFWFGLFTALAMLISQLATLTMLPSLFLLTRYPRLTNPAASR